MTTSGISVIVRCADLLPFAHATVQSVEQQRGVRAEIVLIAEGGTPASAREWLSAFAHERELKLVSTPATTPGAVRNAGIAASRAPYIVCVDAGDVLSPFFLEAVIAELDADSSVALVTSAVRWLGPGPAQKTVSPSRIDLRSVIEDTELVHNASAFRRASWLDLRGFDERLEALDAYEFWLRLLSRGARGAIAREASLIRPHRERVLYRRAWDRDVHVRSFQSVVEAHRALFAFEAVAGLCAREQAIEELAEKYRHAIDRRDAAVSEIDRLKAKADELRRTLPEQETTQVDLGDFKRTTPVARDWGYERGQPIDRYYIERFLESNAADIRGAVLEVQEADYTQKFGGSRVTRSDVIDLDASNARATVVSDLRSASNIPSCTYDCVIMTQTIHVVDDMTAVIRECERILKPGGVLLATLPSASRVCLEYGHDGDFWRVTEAGARHLFSKAFRADQLEVAACGNVLTNAAFLYGLGCHELTAPEFEAVDPYFPLLVTVRARKPAIARTSRDEGAVVLLYHRVATPASDVHGMAVSPRAFRAHMAHLRERYVPMPLSDLVASAAAGQVPPGAVAVTFDDGYVDNYAIASPILTEYEIPATFFMTTDGLDRHYEYWWDRLERMLIAQSTLPGSLSLDLPGGRQIFDTSSDAGRMLAHREIYKVLAVAAGDVRDAILADLSRWSGMRAAPDHSARRMLPHELMTLANRPGHTVGAHSAKHLMLPKQPLDVQLDEISGSRKTLESLLNRSVAEFAYPFGAYDAAVVENARRASVAAAVTCDERDVRAGVDPLRVPRLEVKPQHAIRFGEWLVERFQDRYLM